MSEGLQQLVVGLVVGAALGAVILRAVRSWRAARLARDGCGTGCGCGE